MPFGYQQMSPLQTLGAIKIIVNLQKNDIVGHIHHQRQMIILPFLL